MRALYGAQITNSTCIMTRVTLYLVVKIFAVSVGISCSGLAYYLGLCISRISCISRIQLPITPCFDEFLNGVYSASTDRFARFVSFSRFSKPNFRYSNQDKEINFISNFIFLRSISLEIFLLLLRFFTKHGIQKQIISLENFRIYDKFEPLFSVSNRMKCMGARMIDVSGL